MGLHSNSKAWRCFHNYEPVLGTVGNEEDVEDECDFDMCEMCVRWALYCE